ncbi:MAG: YigZ family protein [Clostridia bacterium]|nr:YigZ family protein [Oscillospiraceae bacterium]MBQ6702324.1 YigZ family protein [Clostridia bacterium]
MKDSNQNGEKLYTTLGGEGFFEITIDRSVFYGYAKHVTEEKDAIDFINSIKKKHSDARHNVYAYVLKDTNTTRYSDDGEPAGTAGMPVLDVIRKTGFTDAVIVVTRYFGGILLGKGGLVRAYTAAAKGAAEDAEITTFTQYTEFEMRCTYADHEKIRYECQFFDVIEDGIDYSDTVLLKLAIKSPEFERFDTRISEITAGKIRAVKIGERFDKT